MKQIDPLSEYLGKLRSAILTMRKCSSNLTFEDKKETENA